MNTRVQVEHPVSEMITGVDIVQMQIRIAAGERMGLRQRDIVPKGHAIECRINAEDPYSFVPSPGRISFYHPPGGPGIRVDSHVYNNYVVPPHYDSLIGKLIARDSLRAVVIGAGGDVALLNKLIARLRANPLTPTDLHYGV
jgi:acetyl-CoA carboxylase biotin carboxylase subunit